MRTNPPKRAALALVAVLALIGLGLGAGASPAAAADDLVGTFRITAGSCSGGATGSYFRMIQPTGNATSGPWVDNADSTCSDKGYTLLTPGSDGGLVTGGYQPAPTPGFDGKGNSLASRLIRPVRFFGVNFSGSTNPTDLQVGQAVAAPKLTADGGKLSGDLRAFNATWNKLAFNQGSPKPDGSSPGLTTRPTGTYDAATGAYTLQWTTTIVGGPFDKFTGLWHLEGTFAPATGGSAAPAPGGTTATTAAPAGGATGQTVPAADGPSTTVADAAGGDAPDVAAPAVAPEEQQRASNLRVQDDSFVAPTWLVLLLAALGIGGVVALLVLGQRRSDDLEGTSTSA